MRTVSLTLTASDDARPLVRAIRADNPEATVIEMPSVVKIDAPGRLVLRTETVSEQLGRPWDPQELHLTMISLSGFIEQDDDQFTLSWGSR